MCEYGAPVKLLDRLMRECGWPNDSTCGGLIYIEGVWIRDQIYRISDVNFGFRLADV